MSYYINFLQISLKNSQEVSLLKSVLREVKILGRLKSHENIVQISNVVLSTTNSYSPSSVSFTKPFCSKQITM